MEPHAFARFNKVTFQALFKFTYTQSGLLMNHDYSIDAEDAARFKAFLGRSNIINHLVKLLSNSPNINSFSVHLSMEVEAEYYVESDSHDQSKERDSKFRSWANRGAAELWVDSGQLEPLRRLSNVKSFGFNFDMLDHNNEIFQPHSKYAEMAQELRDAIQQNWVLKHQKPVDGKGSAR